MITLLRRKPALPSEPEHPEGLTTLASVMRQLDEIMLGIDGLSFTEENDWTILNNQIVAMVREMLYETKEDDLLADPQTAITINKIVGYLPLAACTERENYSSSYLQGLKNLTEEVYAALKVRERDRISTYQNYLTTAITRSDLDL